MNGRQLMCVINCDPEMKQKVIGVFARDQLPGKSEDGPIGMIVNTDTRDKPGTHWLAIYLEKGVGEFFDSCGRAPDYYSFDFNFKFNDKRLQSSTSNVCGQYCLYYLMQRCRNVPMQDIVNSFSDNYAVNDDFVAEIIQNVFSCCFESIEGQACCAEQ